jgi:hypothetical protein
MTKIVPFRRSRIIRQTRCFCLFSLRTAYMYKRAHEPGTLKFTHVYHCVKNCSVHPSGWFTDHGIEYYLRRRCFPNYRMLCCSKMFPFDFAHSRVSQVQIFITHLCNIFLPFMAYGECNRAYINQSVDLQKSWSDPWTSRMTSWPRCWTFHIEASQWHSILFSDLAWGKGSLVSPGLGRWQNFGKVPAPRSRLNESLGNLKLK